MLLSWDLYDRYLGGTASKLTDVYHVSSKNQNLFKHRFSQARPVGDVMLKCWIGKVPVDGAEEHAAYSRVLVAAPSDCWC